MSASANKCGSSSGTNAAFSAVLLPASYHTLINEPSHFLSMVGNKRSLHHILAAATHTAFSLSSVQAAAGSLSLFAYIFTVHL